jgi:hypothetical protein
VKRGDLSIPLILFIIALMAGLVFAVIIFPKIVSLSKSSVSGGCPQGVPIKTECPCNGERISSGYCCPEGPSEVPCSATA